MVLRPKKKWKSCTQNHGNFVRIMWIISRKFPTENPIFLNKIFHADLIQYSDSAHLFKVVGWFQIFLHSFCIEIFWSQGTEHAKIAPLHGRLQLNCWNWVWDYHIAYYAESQQQSDFRTSFKLVPVILEKRAKNMLKWQFRYHFREVEKHFIWHSTVVEDKDDLLGYTPTTPHLQNWITS